MARLEHRLYPQCDNQGHRPHASPSLWHSGILFYLLVSASAISVIRNFQTLLNIKRERKGEFPALLNLGSLCKYAQPHSGIFKLCIPGEWVALSRYLTVSPNCHTLGTWPFLPYFHSTGQTPLLTALGYSGVWTVPKRTVRFFF